VMKRPTRGAFECGAVAMAAMLCVWGALSASAQSDNSPPQSSVRGENLSAKPAPALFQADCTGGGCHKGPQGLAKNQSQSGLASFLREHYTNSRESAAALTAYLLKLPSGPAQSDPRAARATSPGPRGGGGPSGGGADGPSWFGPEPSPGPNEARTPRQQQGTRPPARSAARSGEDAAPAATPPAPAPAPAAEPAKPQAQPRNQRGRQQPTAAAAAPPAPEAAPPPPPPAPPPPPQFDIFD